jgi:hypothetical protein
LQEFTTAELAARYLDQIIAMINQGCERLPIHDVSSLRAYQHHVPAAQGPGRLLGEAS